jgi:hypothetical protein
MAMSTGPLLAAGAIAVGNESVVQGQPVNWTKILGVGVVATVFAGLEHIPGAEMFVAGIAWIALVTIVFTRPKTGMSPAENFIQFVGW